MFGTSRAHRWLTHLTSGRDLGSLGTPSSRRPRPPPLSTPLLRLRSDDQLVALFRAGNEDAFRVIHDRYRQRLFAYVRQMLSAGSRQDAEDVLQDVFVRAYGALRADDARDVRAWLYRVAHNRCIDQLRRPIPPAAEIFEVSRTPLHDPLEEAQRRDDLRRLVDDVRRLPEQQRSALLMREIDGLSYADLAAALDVTVPAVKSLLVRARVGLAEAAEARDADCGEIRADLLARLRPRRQGLRARPQAHARLRRLPRVPRRAARRCAARSPRSRRSRPVRSRSPPSCSGSAAPPAAPRRAARRRRRRRHRPGGGVAATPQGRRGRLHGRDHRRRRRRGQAALALPRDHKKPRPRPPVVKAASPPRQAAAAVVRHAEGSPRRTSIRHRTDAAAPPGGGSSYRGRLERRLSAGQGGPTERLVEPPAQSCRGGAGGTSDGAGRR